MVPTASSPNDHKEPEAASTKPDPSAWQKRLELGDSVTLLRHMVRGMIRMIDARSRAQSEFGLTRTTQALDSKNPLHFIRSADRALRALLVPPGPDSMDATRAIDEAFLDLQAYEIATMAAARVALKRSIELLSPAATRAQCGRRGWVATLFPLLRERALWRAYENGFECIIKGSHATFGEIFSAEFAREYNNHVAQARERRRSQRN